MPFFSQVFTYGNKPFPSALFPLFVAKLLHASATVMTHFFMPLFLFRWGSEYLPGLGLTLSSFQQGMITVGGFLLLQHILIFGWSPVASGLIRRIGYRNGMIVGQACNIAFLAVLQVVEAHPLLLLVALMIEAVKVPLFWTSYHSLFAQSALHANMGKSVGTIEFFTRLIHVALPAVAGLVIATFGFSSLFLIGLCIQLVSMMVLTLVREPDEPRLLTSIRWSLRKRPQVTINLQLAQGGKYFVDALQYVWPLFVVLLVGSVEQVGYLYSIVFFLSLILIYFAGWSIDHQRSRRPLLFSGGVLSMLWLGRAAVVSPWAVLGIDAVDKLMASIFVPYYDAMVYKSAKGKYVLDFFTQRESIISLAAIVFWTIFVGYFMLFGAWQPLMVLGSVGMILATRVKESTATNKRR